VVLDLAKSQNFHEMLNWIVTYDKAKEEVLDRRTYRFRDAWSDLVLKVRHLPIPFEQTPKGFFLINHFAFCATSAAQ
jgi:hypothetical protein